MTAFLTNLNLSNITSSPWVETITGGYEGGATKVAAVGAHILNMFGYVTNYLIRGAATYLPQVFHWPATFVAAHPLITAPVLTITTLYLTYKACQTLGITFHSPIGWNGKQANA